MKKSTVHHIDHDLSDFKDRTRKKTKVEAPHSLEEGLRQVPEAQEGVQLHDKIAAIRKRNADAYDAKNFKAMTYKFLVRVYDYDRDQEMFEGAQAELNRRDDEAQAQEAEYEKADQKKKQIEVRNHDALISFPKKFYAMTYGLLTMIAKRDPEFMKRLEQNGYKFDAYDFVEAGFEVNRRLQDKEKKIGELGAQLEQLEADPVANKVAIEKCLYVLERLTSDGQGQQVEAPKASAQ